MGKKVAHKIPCIVFLTEYKEGPNYWLGGVPDCVGILSYVPEKKRGERGKGELPTPLTSGIRVDRHDVLNVWNSERGKEKKRRFWEKASGAPHQRKKKGGGNV